MFFLAHLIYSFSVIYGNTQSLFYELFYELILNPKLEYVSVESFHKIVVQMVISSCEDIHQGVPLVEHIMHGFMLLRLRQKATAGCHAVKLLLYGQT